MLTIILLSVSILYFIYNQIKLLEKLRYDDYHYITDYNIDYSLPYNKKILFAQKLLRIITYYLILNGNPSNRLIYILLHICSLQFNIDSSNIFFVIVCGIGLYIDNLFLIPFCML